MAAIAIHGVFILCWTVITLLLPATTKSESSGFNLKLLPIYSPELPYFPKNLTLEERYRRIAQLSARHAHHLRSSSSASPNEMRPPVRRLLNNYYVAVLAIGTPPFPVNLALDTGSDRTWLQCEGCTNCFQIATGSFDYHSSTTYRYLHKDDPRCIPKMSYRQKCTYVIRYVNANTSGVLSTETFTFSRRIIRPEDSAHSVVFGCGMDTGQVSFGYNDGPHNLIAGILGLGRGPLSFVMQLEDRTLGRFSYCLQPWAAPNGTTYLSFGNYARIRGDPRRTVQTTPLLQGQNQYYVRLLGISIERNRLPIDPAFFELTRAGWRGFTIDSGAPNTYLVRGAYSILESSMVEYLRRHLGWVPMRGGGNPYELCYITPGGRHNLPSMTFHLHEASLVLDSSAVFEKFGNMTCMIIGSINEPAPNVLGAFQQANHRFLFNLAESTVSFVPERCGYN